MAKLNLSSQPTSLVIAQAKYQKELLNHLPTVLSPSINNAGPKK